MGKGNGPDISDVLAAMLSGRVNVHQVNIGGDDEAEAGIGDNGYKVTISHEAQAMELAAMGERYLAGVQFEPGDMCTPRKGFAIKGEGAPHVVLDVLQKVEPVWIDTEDSSTRQGRMLDMRVACYVRNDVVTTFWVESWQYEPFED